MWTSKAKCRPTASSSSGSKDSSLGIRRHTPGRFQSGYRGHRWASGRGANDPAPACRDRRRWVAARAGGEVLIRRQVVVVKRLIEVSLNREESTQPGQVLDARNFVSTTQMVLRL